jgi:hypothetical protein
MRKQLSKSEILNLKKGQVIVLVDESSQWRYDGEPMNFEPTKERILTVDCIRTTQSGRVSLQTIDESQRGVQSSKSKSILTGLFNIPINKTLTDSGVMRASYSISGYSRQFNRTLHLLTPNN